MAETPALKQLELGNTGDSYAPLGIGAWAWGDRIVWGYGQGGYTDDDIKQAFEASLEGGVTFFDTAEVYGSGQSEKILGRLLEASEHQALVATKYFPYPWRIGKNSVLKALKKSLERLGLERVDLYQLHWAIPFLPVERIVDKLAVTVKEGLTRTVGVSNYNVEQTEHAYARLAKQDIHLYSNQIKYNLLHRKPEFEGLVDKCKELNTLIIAYSPLAQGLLTGKYTPENPPPGVRGRRYSGDELAEINSFVNLLRRVGENHGGKTPSQVSLNWLICKGTLPIPGVKNMRQTRDNLGALGWRLEADEIALLEEKAPQLDH
ncbi:MAG: aldo/keto reductase [Anaerolineales bacterium]|nr:aldo/keto reductase [Anaerolineales bacterium]